MGLEGLGVTLLAVSGLRGIRLNHHLVDAIGGDRFVDVHEHSHHCDLLWLSGGLLQLEREHAVNTVSR